MTVNKRKKSSRGRGCWTYGFGSKKKHRGAGHRGGRGRAGSGKRGDANKPKYWKDPDYSGKHGFKKKGLIDDIKAINTDYLEKNIDKLVKDRNAEFKEGIYVIDLSKLGYDKLLCKGVVNKRFDITVWKASRNVKEKIEGAGGKINILERPAEEVKEAE
ncbi:uL15 family ribosomal protein [Candidatus Woesearchaeota archaeon]|nr:uL15 family ribosomal protein [Candidatus Woesearchaeota archaeon]